MLPRPSTAEPSEITAIILPFIVYSRASSLFLWSREDTAATPGVYTRDRSARLLTRVAGSIVIFPPSFLWSLMAFLAKSFLFMPTQYNASYEPRRPSLEPLPAYRRAKGGAPQARDYHRARPAVSLPLPLRRRRRRGANCRIGERARSEYYRHSR